MSDIMLPAGVQKIIVNSPSKVSIVRAGPIGPPGINAGSATAASGEVVVANNVWIMDHNLQFKPQFMFFTQDGLNELEPYDLQHVNNTRTLAVWPEPTVGTWIAS